MLKTVHDVLNKLTSSAQFDKLLGTIQKMNISTDDQKSGVIELLFEKVNLISILWPHIVIKISFSVGC